MPNESDERFNNTYYHSPQQHFDNTFKHYLIGRIEAFVSGPAVLELGFLDGIWTDRLLQMGHRVDIVEGSPVRCQDARTRYGQDARVSVHEAMLEDFETDIAFNTVLAGDMLQFVDNTTTFLTRLRQWLAPHGTLLVTVPNSRSLHRRVGTLMGLKTSPDELAPNDLAVGARRSFDAYSLRRLLSDCGYNVEFIRGSFLKPLSSAQMQDWSPELFSAYDQLGEELQEYCYYLYAKAQPR